MKTLKDFLLLTISTGLLAACGGRYQKNPVEDLDTLREQAKQQQEETGPAKPQVITEYVEKEKIVVREQAVLDDKFVLIELPGDVMTFVEGQSTSYQIVGRPLIPGLKIKLVAQGLPEGAILMATDKADHYSLTWTPALYTVADQSVEKSLRVKLSIQVLEVPAGKDKAKIEALKREEEVLLHVLRPQAVPSDLTIEGLGSEVAEGTRTPFQVTVKIPGVNEKATSKPRLIYSYEPTHVAGTDQQELDGTRHLIADSTKREPEYMGDFKWKFYLIYDTQGISVQTPLKKDGQPLLGAEHTLVRLSFVALSPYRTLSPEVVKQIKIKLVNLDAVPKFDFSGLTTQNLEVTPGVTSKLNFFVESPHPRAVVKMDMPDISKIKGVPAVVCAFSKKSKGRQDCTLTWKVPCDVEDGDLTQEIALSAVAEVDGKNSGTQSYVLKTERSQTKSACKPKATGGQK